MRARGSVLALMLFASACTAIADGQAITARPTAPPLTPLTVPTVTIAAPTEPAVEPALDDAFVLRPIPLPQWRLVWFDEFDTGSLSADHWQPENSTYGHAGGSIHCYTPENVTVANDVLSLTARSEVTVCPGGRTREYSSGMVTTRGLAGWSQGRFEIRLRAPLDQGLWSAAWLSPVENVYGEWPASGEIDIFEQIGGPDAVAVGTAHWSDRDGSPDKSVSEAPRPDGQFHTYSLEWSASELLWAVDGVRYHRLNSWASAVGAAFPAPFDHPFELRLNLAVGGRWPDNPTSATGWPAALEIDWVRVYEWS